jgi:integrase/recombinase XerD
VGTLQSAVQSFINELEVTSKRKTVAAYQHPLKRFSTLCGPETELSEINRDHLISFMKLIKDEGKEDRTIFNYTSRCRAFLRKNKITFPDVKLPRYSEPIPDAYSLREVKALIAVCKPHEKMIVEFFLGSGCREAEVSDAEWSDISFERKTLHIQPKRNWDWTPKTHEEREVPLADTLLSALLPFAGHGLIFPNKDSKLNGHFLKVLKRVAKRAGMPEGDCNLHKFRRTYATWLHENGTSANQVRLWLGHKRLTTTLRYLAAGDNHSEKTRKNVNSAFASLETR